MTQTRVVRTRDALAAATVWLPFLVFAATWIAWSDRLPAVVGMRNDIDADSAPSLPMWVTVLGTAVVLIGAGIGAISSVPAAPNESQSPRTPLFWAGAIAGFVCVGWMFQMWGAIDPPTDPNRANALAGFATLGAGLYGLIPFFIARKPLVPYSWAA